MDFNYFCFPKPSKFIKQSTPKSIKKVIDLYAGFLSILAPFWPPTWGSTGGPVGTFWWSCWALGAILGPTWPQEPSKRPSWPDFEAILGPRWPQEPSKRPSWPDFAVFWVPSWRVWGANLVDLGCQLDGFGPLLVGSQLVGHPSC